MDEFLQFVVKLAAIKIKSLIKDEAFVYDRRLLSHLIDETVFFEKELFEGKILSDIFKKIFLYIFFSI